MKNLRHYLNHLWASLNMSYQSAAVYRGDFLIRIIRSFFEIFLTLTVIGAVFRQTPTIGQWTRSEATLVASLALFIISFIFFFFGSGLEGLHRQIVSGRFDRLLLQPMDSQWLASTGLLFVTNIFRLGLNSIVMLILISRLGPFPWISWLLFGVTLMSALVIYYCLMFAAAALSFWALSGEQFYLMNSLTGVAKYPLDTFNLAFKWLFTFFPIIFIATVPAQALLGKPNQLIYLSPFVAAASFYLTRRFWLKGLHAYDSASS